MKITISHLLLLLISISFAASQYTSYACYASSDCAETECCAYFEAVGTYSSMFESLCYEKASIDEIENTVWEYGGYMMTGYCLD